MTRTHDGEQRHHDPSAAEFLVAFLRPSEEPLVILGDGLLVVALPQSQTFACVLGERAGWPECRLLSHPVVQPELDLLGKCLRSLPEDRYRGLLGARHVNSVAECEARRDAPNPPAPTTTWIGTSFVVMHGRRRALHQPGIPFNSLFPRSSKSMPDPAMSVGTAGDTPRSPGDRGVRDPGCDADADPCDVGPYTWCRRLRPLYSPLAA